MNLQPFIYAFLAVSLTLSGCGGGSGGGNSDDQSSEDPLPTVSIANATADIEDSSIYIPVTLSSSPNSVVSIDYTTSNGTAIEDAHYIAKSGTLEFSGTETSKNITIALVDGRDISSPVAFTVSLSNPVNATIEDAEASITLLDANHNAMFSNPAMIANWGSKGVFNAAENCTRCHKAGEFRQDPSTLVMFDSQGNDVSPFTKWKHSTMANALNDPYFNAVVEEEVHVFPHLKGFIEDTCMSCHAPMAYTHAHQTGEGLVKDETTFVLENGGYPFAAAIEDQHAREGISCTVCHQIQPDNFGNIASMSGHYKINSATENQDPSTGTLDARPHIFGPFNSPVTGPMTNNTDYTPQYAAHISESAMCATCHNLYTPTLDLEGRPIKLDNTGLAIAPDDPAYESNTNIAQFPEQTPFWEWQNSIYSDVTNSNGNKTCQACHMAEPEPNYVTKISTNGPSSVPDRPSASDGDSTNSAFSAHEFIGGNSYLLTLIKTYMAEIGLGTDSGYSKAGFDEKIQSTQAFLQTSASLEILSKDINDGILTIPVKITNNSGHKLPTSYPSRRMWIHTKVTDATGSIVFESGAFDENGRILNKDENFTSDTCLSIKKEAGFDSIAAGCYEPHQNLIDDSSQVAIYEGVLGDENQDITHVLLHARQYLKDNRIPPKGWTLARQHTNPADPNLKDDGIFGVANVDSDFAPGKESSGADGTDIVTYKVHTNGLSGPFDIEVELRFQTIKPSFVYAMHADDEEHGGISGDSYVARFKAMYAETPPIAELLAADTASTTQ